MIVPFDRNGGCPPGWEEFTDGQGRVIIGQGQGIDLTNRTYRETLGEESITLSVENIPRHSHYLWARSIVDQGDGVSVASGYDHEDATSGMRTRDLISETAPAPNAPIQILPPYIALYWCTPSRGGE